MSEESKTKKPVGLVLIAIWAGLGCLVNFIGGLFFLIAGAAAGQASVVGQAATITVIIGILYTALGALSGATVYGLWSLQEWGLKLAKILYILSIPIEFTTFFLPNRSTATVIMGVAGIVVAIVILIYLTRPKTEALFEE